MSVVRVLHITEAASGGVWRNLRWIVPGLKRRNIGSDLILSARRADPGFRLDIDALREQGCRVDVFPMARGPAPLSDALAVQRIRRRLREWAPQIVHTHATKAGLLGRIAAAAFPDIRTVHSPHAFFFEAYRPGLRRRLGIRVERRMARKTTRFVFVSDAEEALGRNLCGVSEAQGCVIENGLPADFAERLLPREQARAQLGMAPDTVAVCVPGRLAHQKGQDWLLRALPSVDAAGIGLQVFICGAGPAEASLQRLSKRLGLTHVVHWLGHVPELARMMPAFDAVVLPSRYEAFPYALLETLAAGVPVIASDIPAHFPRSEIRQFVAGVPVNDDRGLARTLEELLRDTSAQDRLREWGPSFVRQQFKLESQLAQLEACYRDVLSGSDAAGSAR